MIPMDRFIMSPQEDSIGQVPLVLVVLGGFIFKIWDGECLRIVGLLVVLSDA